MNSADEIIKSFKSGKPVIVFDNPKREGEADMIIHASRCTPRMIRLLRKDAGGLICLCTDKKSAKKMGLEFFTDFVRKSENKVYQKLAIKKTPYGDEPSFSMYINSRKVYTGITDEDRSLTVQEFDKMLFDNKTDEFITRFYAPGHIPLLISRGLENREGHTEMAIAIAKKAQENPAVVICEMLADNGKALSWKDAQNYAKTTGLVAIDSKTLMMAINES